MLPAIRIELFMTFQIRQPMYVFLLPRRHLMGDRNSSVIKVYEQYAIDVAVLMGADLADAKAEMRDMVDWEREVAKVSNTSGNFSICFWRQ